MKPQRTPAADDLLVFLVVARLGRYNAAAQALGITHTTVSRHIAALESRLGGRVLERSAMGWELTPLGSVAIKTAEEIERSLGSLDAALARDEDPVSGLVRLSAPDGFAAHVVVPAIARVQRTHPKLDVEMISATRRVSQNRSGLDVEIIAGGIDTSRAETYFLTDYFLRLYATREYLDRAGEPVRTDQLSEHTLISYVESELQVKQLGYRSTGLPAPARHVQCTSIFAQVEAVRCNAGIGLLPSFMVHGQADIVPVLPGVFWKKLPFIAAAREVSLRSPGVQAVIRALLDEIRERQDQLAS